MLLPHLVPILSEEGPQTLVPPAKDEDASPHNSHVGGEEEMTPTPSPAAKTTSHSNSVTLTASEGGSPEIPPPLSPTAETTSFSYSVTLTASEAGPSPPVLCSMTLQPSPRTPMVVKLALRPPQRVGHTSPRSAPLVSLQYLTRRTQSPQPSSTWLLSPPHLEALTSSLGQHLSF